jgi:ribosomal-protein-alanine N-acetyltransferase
MSAPLAYTIEVVRPDDPMLDEVDALAEPIFTGSTRISAHEEVQRAFTRLWVARQNDPSLGVLVVGFLLTWRVADEVHVLNIATSPLFRRMGVARELMRHCVRYARDNQARLLLLEVRRSNDAAISLYRSLGFHSINLRPGYYSDNLEDAVEMAMVLDETGAVVPGTDVLEGG